jgi:hypothetical protein
MKESAKMGESSVIGAGYETHQPIQWKAKWKVEKFHGDNIDGTPYEVIEREGNLLMNGGASCIWEALIGNATGTSGQTLTYFDNSNAYIGVGNGTTAAAATQTDLQASVGTANQIQTEPEQVQELLHSVLPTAPQMLTLVGTNGAYSMALQEEECLIVSKKILVLRLLLQLGLSLYHFHWLKSN